MSLDLSSLPILVETAEALAGVAARLARADRIAVDVESNGLHAYRAALCVLQLAWPEDGGLHVAVVDTMAVAAAPLAPIMGEAGPVKVLHDLTFDARLLAEAGVPLARVRDTSVAARLLGLPQTGLAPLLEERLGVQHDKRLQHHDWARRPLGADEIDYLAGDVRHLLALDESLAVAAAALDIEPEIADECAYKLGTAAAPPRDGRPIWGRIKGAASLDAPGLATLRRLFYAREAAAAAEDVAPFKVTSNETLFDLAVRRPSSAAELEAIRGAVAGLAGRYRDAWLAAVVAGAADGDVPVEERAEAFPEPPSREEIAERRALEKQVMRWRKAEAARRGVNEQVVLPGHCVDDVVSAFVWARAAGADAAALREVLAQVPGMGARRFERYGEALAALVAAG